MHIVACRIINKKDIFSYVLYFVVNNISYEVAFNLLRLNFTFFHNLYSLFDNTWEHVDSQWFLRPDWFTYNVSLGGVYYINGRKKVSNNTINFDWCDLDLIYEFFNVEFEWQEFRLIWDPHYGHNGAYRLWRHDRQLPPDASWAVERYH